jgi:integrase
MLKCIRRPKSPNWIMRGTIRGIRIEESTGTSDRRRAEEIRANREDELYKQSIYGRRATKTFAEAALSYQEIGGRHCDGGERRFLARIIRHFGTTPLGQIDLDALDRGAAKLFPDAAPSTRNRQFYTPAIAVLRHAAARRWCASLIIKRPKSPKGRIRYLKIEEADRLIERAADHLRPLLIFLFYTGARAGEAVWLDWRHVDLARSHVDFFGKNGDERGVPLHPRVVAALANLKHRDGEVFRRPDGRPYSRPKRPDDKSAGTRIKTAFGGACRRAGIIDFTPHGCRHTWATWHYAKNRDLGALQRLGGWKSIAMVMRYAHVNVEELSHTINALSGGIFGDTLSKKRKRR